MRRYFLSGTGLLLIAAGIALIPRVTQLPPAATPPSPRFYVPAAAGSPEDPGARANWEVMRLRDPKTGDIPGDIRRQELAFARSIPSKRDYLEKVLHKSRVQADLEVLQWSSRGPFNIGGRTRAFAVDVSNENILLAGGVAGGMWRSTDGGATWQRTTASSDLANITCLAQDTRPGKTNIWYYGTGELLNTTTTRVRAAPYRGDGIFKSVDGGVTWKQLPSTASHTPHFFDQAFDYVWTVAVDPSNLNQDEVYAATFGVIFRSTDGGRSWQKVLGEFDSQFSAFFTDVVVTSTGVVYAALSQATTSFNATPAIVRGIYRSENGIDWTEITPAEWPARYNRIAFCTAPSDENILYFVANTPGSGTLDHQLWKYTYLSGDGSGTGGQWEDRSANIPAFGGRVGDFDSQTSYNMMIRVLPTNPDIVFLGGTNLYRSTDGFTTRSRTRTRWVGGYNDILNNASLYPDHHPDQHGLVFLQSNPKAMYSYHDGGVSFTDNNGLNRILWQSLNNGYLTTQFYAIAIFPNAAGNQFILGGMQDNGTWGTSSPNGLRAWERFFGGDGGFCALPSSQEAAYVSAQKGQIYRVPLEDFVTTARVDPSGVSESDYSFINPFTLDASDASIMYLPIRNIIWRNNNLVEIPGGTSDPTSVNWEQLTNTRVQNARISAVASSKSSAHVLYYGTDRGRVYKLPEAHTGQPVPIDITGFNFPANAFVSCLAIDPSDADKVLVVFSNYNVQSLFYTNSGGDHWTPVGGNLEPNSSGNGPGPSTRWASILPQGDVTHYFVATSTGLYSTAALNGSATVWSQEAPSAIGNVVVEMVVTRPADGMVVAATNGNGVFSSTIATGVNEVAGTAPSSFRLLPNYPNPFNPSTNIRFELPRAELVTVKIFDMLGREVRTLVRAPQPAGVHEQQWDGRDNRGLPAATGLYLVRMQAGEFSAWQKITLAK